MRRLGRDPALLVTVLVLWALLGLFVLFPMAKLSWLAFFEAGRPSLGHVWTILADPNHRQAFANSLLLAALVGVGGTWGNMRQFDTEQLAIEYADWLGGQGVETKIEPDPKNGKWSMWWRKRK